MDYFASIIPVTRVKAPTLWVTAAGTLTLLIRTNCNCHVMPRERQRSANYGNWKVFPCSGVGAKLANEICIYLDNRNLFCHFLIIRSEKYDEIVMSSSCKY